LGSYNFFKESLQAQEIQNFLVGTQTLGQKFKYKLVEKLIYHTSYLHLPVSRELFLISY